MSVQLPDTIAACNMIRQNREYNRRALVRKAVFIEIPDFGVRAALIVDYNKNTGNVSWAHCIRYKSLAFYPTINQKLRCTNQHALDVLKKERVGYKLYRQKQKCKERESN